MNQVRATIAGVPALSRDPDKLREAVRIVELERTRCADRRRRVLARPDIAARLVTELGYSRPDVWNGWIPPLSLPDDSPSGDGFDKVNHSPRRKALMAIMADVAEREAG